MIAFGQRLSKGEPRGVCDSEGFPEVQVPSFPTEKTRQYKRSTSERTYGKFRIIQLIIVDLTLLKRFCATKLSCRGFRFSFVILSLRMRTDFAMILTGKFLYFEIEPGGEFFKHYWYWNFDGILYEVP